MRKWCMARPEYENSNRFILCSKTNMSLCVSIYLSINIFVLQFTYMTAYPTFPHILGTGQAFSFVLQKKKKKKKKKKVPHFLKT